MDDLLGGDVEQIVARVQLLLTERERGLTERFAALEKATNVGLSSLEKLVMVGFELRDKQVEVALIAQDARTTDAFDARDKAVNAALNAAKEAVNAALAAAKEAVTKAELASGTRFESVNEFRKTLTDQTNTFMPRLEVDQRFAALDKALDAVVKQQTTLTGRAQGLTAGWGYLVAAIGVLMGIVGLVASYLK